MHHPLWQKFVALNSPAFCSYKLEHYPRQNGPGTCSALFLNPQPQPAKGLVIFVHGAGNDFLYPYLALFRALLLKQFAVFSFNVDGHGQEDTTLLHPNRLVSCIDDAYSHAASLAGKLPVHLIGHSMGGALSLSFLGHYPQRAVTSATIISTPLWVEHLEIALLKEGKSLLRSVLYSQLALYGFYDLIPPLGLFKRREFPLRFDPSLHDRNEKGLFAISQRIYNQLELEKILPQVQVPTLLCYGSWDSISPLSHGQQMSRIIPHAHLLSVAQETHFTTLFAPATEQEIVRWLTAHTA